MSLLTAFDNTAPTAKTVALATAFSNTAPVAQAASAITVGTTIALAITIPITLANLFDTATFQGVTLSEGDIVLVMGQTNPVENGIYSLGGSPDAPTRVTSAGYAEAVTGGNGYATIWKFNVTAFKSPADNSNIPNVSVFVTPGKLGTDAMRFTRTQPLITLATFDNTAPVAHA